MDTTILYFWINIQCNPTLRVFNEPSNLENFKQLPASLFHYYGYDVGLFIHSVDVAWWLFHQPGLTEEEQCLVVVAGLLHDIGKDRTTTTDRQYTRLGRDAGHDELTLRVLSESLSWLSQKNPALEAKLCYILTWDRKKDPIPRYPLALLVRTADQTNAGREVSRLIQGSASRVLH